ncbi:MAG: UvrD-helicase domain-containing protein [Candidatus Cryptobacteroides sp.]
MMKILKASAGSGKTYNLARTYIELLFRGIGEDPRAYRHILAVTFTNKATDEMKSRILKELHILSTAPGESGYFDYFVPSLFSSENGIRQASKRILSDILHDYGSFAVSTIDRFFQQTLRAFSREIGQFASYQVELDRDSLVNESVDRILDGMTVEDSELLEWLTDSVMKDIEDGGRYSLESSLKGMAVRLRSPEFRDKLRELGIEEKDIYTKEVLRAIGEKCRKVIDGFVRKVRSGASDALAALDACALTPEQSYRKFLTQLYKFTEISANDLVGTLPTDTFVQRAPDVELWFSKKDSQTLVPRVSAGAAGAVAGFCNLFRTEYSVFCTAKIIDSQLYDLGIAGELKRSFDELVKEKNVLCIDDSNVILKGIIDGSDVPFIYEKTGVRYEHFLLDEFQDTSRVQWENFLPLLKNSESQGFDNLVVGDVKQSIYRWRGSDWNILGKEVGDSFNRVQIAPLDVNYRSLGNIVNFNNAFFREAASVVDSIVPGADGQSVCSIYGDVTQKVHNAGGPQGSVRVTFCDGKAEGELAEVLRSIKEVTEAGMSLGDITVLVRTNASGERVAAFLMQNNVNVLTDESLKVKNSPVVRRLVSLLSYSENQGDEVGGFLARSLDVEIPRDYHSLADLCEALLRSLRDVDRESFDKDTLYIQSFMDSLQDYVSLNGNSLKGFLTWWDGKNPSISSPSAGDAVRIMTVHKSKGLDFPYVIFPFAEEVGLYKSSRYWCLPQKDGTELETIPQGIFDVELSRRCENTLFAEDYRKESFYQAVDNINTLYVAFTRASKGMHIIAVTPPASSDKYSDFSQILHTFVESGPVGVEMLPGAEGTEKFGVGEISDFTLKKDSGNGPADWNASYPSWPLNPEGESRLRFSADASDFFSEDGSVGVSSSHRLRGIVLHGILSRVVVPQDLEASVSQELSAGTLSEEEAAEAKSLLSERIASALSRGWFPQDGSAVRNEVTLIDSDGTVCRPDRVVTMPSGEIVVIDYKFGVPKPSYSAQVARYAGIFRRMGHARVSTALWYVDTDVVVEGI